MAMIDVSGLTFAYDGSYDNIFEDAAFRIDTDWRLGFCGRNGRGKTTFLNLLMGRFEYRGKISASVAFEYFPFEVENTGLDVLQVLLEIVPDAPHWQIEKELSKLAVGLDVLERPFATLSGGERTKVLLAALFLRENSFLLIDEPTTHLDMHGRETVARYLKGKKGFILVSHDRDFLDECVNHVLSINKTNIEVQSGNFSSWFHNKQLRDGFEIAENERLKKDISRLQAAAKKTAAWSDKAERTKIGFSPNGDVEKHVNRRAYVGEKSRKMMARSKSISERRERAVQEKSDLLKNIDTADKLKIHPLKYHAPRLIELDGVTISYGEKTVLRDFALTISGGERVALMGGNGCGKSSIIKMIVARDENIPHGLKISYVPQDASFLTGGLSDYAAARKIDEPLFKAILRKLDFSRTQFDKDIRSFSSGQKKKVLIAASLCEHAHIYIWDEPLNYIDILSRIQIEELLQQYQPTMLFVEHDRAFCRNVPTREVRL
ncbi:MAG: ABC-F type ribosomal protection protein [Defluviitaleaceae bacterium]|nr:ABC-F type ribosomal protection protein [Defluviitaleaceae bacterium]MCL2263211.1 ABC-F type ribosomal protection protein [Defluviitaleaceae bacterium]